DPTSNLPTYNGSEVYNLDNLNNFTLTFAGDVLGSAPDLTAALSLACDSGGGASPVTIVVTRTSDTVVTIAPNESSPDFKHGSSCSLAGINVPDAAGNTFTMTPKTFKVGANISPVS